MTNTSYRESICLLLKLQFIFSMYMFPSLQANQKDTGSFNSQIFLSLHVKATLQEGMNSFKHSSTQILYLMRLKTRI